MIHRMDPSADPGAEEMPSSSSRCARPSTLPADESEWLRSRDGVRAIAYSQPDVFGYERNGNEVTPIQS
jgi:hypothetical protein